jgi:ABC-type transport system involved in multi-copper enzyme maturation permease subunit
MMKQLLWKDYRLARPLLILGAAVLVTIYGLGALVEIKSAWPSTPTAKAWGTMLVAQGTVALYLSCCITGLLGGHAIACERADRSAHFLAYLPPTKTQILASKFIIAACASAVMWGWLLLSVYVIAPRLGGTPGQSGFGAMISAPAAASLCALTFGVGWLASARLESTTVPILLALTSPVVVSLLLLAALDLLGLPRARMTDWSIPACFAAGTAAFAAGTWTYYARVEP